MNVGEDVDPLRLVVAAEAVLLYVEDWRKEFPHTIPNSPMDERQRWRVLREFEREELAEAVQFLKRLGEVVIERNPG